MAISKAQMRAVAKYNNAHYDRIEVKVPKGRKADVEKYAAQLGESVNAYANRLFKTDIGYDDNSWQADIATQEGSGDAAE